MDEERKKAISEYEMPTTQKGMQRFLGAALFFKSFVPEYSRIAAPLHEMIHKDFGRRTPGRRTIRGVSSSVSNTYRERVADWLSRMERYFDNKVAFNHMSDVHADISLLLHMSLFKEPDLVEKDPDVARQFTNYAKDDSKIKYEMKDRNDTVDNTEEIPEQNQTVALDLTL